MKPQTRYILGIDPDLEKSGIALLDRQRGEFLKVSAVSFVEMSLILRGDVPDKDDITIVLEDSDLSTNWHVNPRDNVHVAAAKGRSIGMCHATARHIKELAEYYRLQVVQMKPLRKCWKGPNGKITHDECVQFMRNLPTRTNQEMRDAALLAWCYANLPIRLKV
jgi:hypothetical protein